MDKYIQLKEVKKIYKIGEREIAAVNGVNIGVVQGEFTIIVGPSGAGKTTVLNLLGGMDRSSGGEILVDGKDIAKLSNKELVTYRRNEVGFVFQFYNLVQNLTALENVELAMQISSNPMDPREILSEVGLEDRMDNFPGQLSGGEQQRVAIARALAKNPKLLLCDEPTGALDYETGKSILKLLQQTCREKKMTVIVITHNQALTPMGDRVIHIRNGVVSGEEMNEHPVDIEEIEW